MQKMLPSTMLLLILQGCSNSLDNQIEKCVQAGIEAYGPYPTEQDRKKQEVRARVVCLKAASGQNS